MWCLLTLYNYRTEHVILPRYEIAEGSQWSPMIAIHEDGAAHLRSMAPSWIPKWPCQDVDYLVFDGQDLMKDLPAINHWLHPSAILGTKSLPRVIHLDIRRG